MMETCFNVSLTVWIQSETYNVIKGEFWKSFRESNNFLFNIHKILLSLDVCV